MKNVSVIVPHYNDLENLDLCLEHLFRQDYSDGQMEIIVADNNSRCGIAAVQDRAGSRVRVILAQEQGAGPARNAAAAVAKGEILAFIDSDCVPNPDWVRRGVVALGKADFIGGRVDVLAAVPGQLTPTEAFETVFAFDFESYVNKKRFTGSGNMFVTRAVFEAVGGFRKTVSEDMEWSHRAIAKGYKLAYAGDVAVGHPARRNWRELAAKWRRLVNETYAYHRLNGGGAGTWLLNVAAVLLSPALHAPKVLASPKLTSWRDRLGALAILFRLRFYRAGRMLAALQAPSPAGAASAMERR